jgi:hypothetical protein
LAKIARVGLPLVIVEKDGEVAWRETSGGDGTRTARIGTDQLAALRRLLGRGRDGAKTSSLPVLETTVGWDTATGAYGLNRVELGLFGKRVWIMFEQGEPDEESGTVGIQFKKEW